MKIKLTYFVLILLILNSFCFAQQVFPYLELKNDEDFEKIDAISVDNKFDFHHLLGNLATKLIYKNNTNEEIPAQFIYPYQTNQNLVELKVWVDEKLIEIKSKSIIEIRKELKTIDASTLFKNQKNNQFLKVDLGKIPANAKIKVELKIAKIVLENQLNYQLTFPELITKRTESFTQINRWNSNLNGFPKILILKFIFQEISQSLK